MSRPMNAPACGPLGRDDDATRLLAALESGAPVEDAEVSEDPHLRHWDKRNWSLALDYYLASAGSAVRHHDEPAAPAEHVPPAEHAEHVPPAGLRLPAPRPLPDIATGEVMFRRCAAGRLPRRGLDADVLGGVLAHGAAAARRRGLDSQGDGWCDAIGVMVVAYDVRDVPPGWYWFRTGPGGHVLSGGHPASSADLRTLLRQAMIGQEAPRDAAATLVLTLDVDRYQRMLPGERGLREAYIDAGRYAHYLILCATAYRLRTHQSPAVKDSLLLELAGLDEARRHVLYTVSIS
jgi:hypothetical protein